jgi:hypothetical protein
LPNASVSVAAEPNSKPRHRKNGIIETLRGKKRGKKEWKKKIKSHEIVRILLGTQKPSTGLVVWQRTVATSHQSRRMGPPAVFAVPFWLILAVGKY